MNTAREEAYCSACWDWLRGITPEEPNPADFDLCQCAGESLMRQCRWEFEKRQLTKARELLPAA